MSHDISAPLPIKVLRVKLSAHDLAQNIGFSFVGGRDPRAVDIVDRFQIDTLIEDAGFILSELCAIRFAIAEDTE